MRKLVSLLSVTRKDVIILGLSLLGIILCSQSANAQTVYYSYKNGDWNQASTWTTDASGSVYTNPGNNLPGTSDQVVILNGRTVTVTNNNNTVARLQIQEGAVLDVQGQRNQNYGVLLGKGRLRSATGDLPAGDYTLFVQAGAGTIELYGQITGSPQLSERVFNNLEINGNENPTVKIGQNTQINGYLIIKGGELTVAGNNLNLGIKGAIAVNSGARFSVTGASNELHVYGDFENEGTVKFTSANSPQYYSNPYEYIDLYFENDTKDQAFVCNGPTTLNRLIIDKGSDDTYMLDVNASNSNNFRLLGPNNSAATNVGSPGNVINNKALEVYAGTLKLGANIVIPRLLTANSSNYYAIDQDATIILEGSDVAVTEQDNISCVVIYGKLIVKGNSTFSSTGAQGVILRAYGVMEIEGNATEPVVNTTVFRTSSRLELGTHRGTFKMSGGVLNISGKNYATTHPAFALPFPDNTLQISGGTININNPSFYSGQNYYAESWLVSSKSENISITGGVVNINSANRSPHINSSAPFYNLNIIGGTGRTVSLESVTDKYSGSNLVVPAAPRRPLVVLNDLTIANSTSFNAQSEDVTVGGDFVLDGNYIPGINTTTFNAFGIQQFANNGTIDNGGLYNLKLKNGALVTVSNDLTIRNELTINPQTTLRDGGNQISVNGNITNSGKHESATGGNIILTGNGEQILSGNGLGKFDNLSLNKTNGSTSMEADMDILGELRLGGTAAVLNIGSNRLQLSSDAEIFNALTGANSGYADFDATRMVQTSGSASDPGIVKVWTAADHFTYPLGNNGKYRPVVIGLTTAPATPGTLGVNATTTTHPLAANSNALSCYWTLKQDNLSGFSIGDLQLKFYFEDADVIGDKATYVPGAYYPVEWTFYDDVNLITNSINEIRFEEVLDATGQYTAGIPDAFGQVQTYFSQRDGNWNDPGSWSYDATGTQPAAEIPGVSSPVVIQKGHTITIKENTRKAGSVAINQGGVLDIGTTTGHYFGLVHQYANQGFGTLRISSTTSTAEFPDGEFGEFLGEQGGTVEYYTTGNDFTLPAGDITAITLLDEGFEGSFPPQGWNRYDDGRGKRWEYSSNAYSGNYSARHQNYYWINENGWLVTPEMNLEEIADYKLTFYRYNNRSNRYRYQGIYISTTTNAPSEFVEFVELGRGVDNTWVKHTIDLSEFIGEEHLYIAFVYQGRNADDVYIDDVKITKKIGEINYHDLVCNPSSGHSLYFSGVDHKISGTLKIKGRGITATSQDAFVRFVVKDSTLVEESGTLRMDDLYGFQLQQKGPLKIGENGVIRVNNAGANVQPHGIYLYDNVENNGVLELNPGNNKYADLYFYGTKNQVYAGTGVNHVNRVFVDKGTDQTAMVDVTADNFQLNTALGQALSIENGTIRFSGTSLNLTLTTNSGFTIPETGCLSVNGATVTIGNGTAYDADLFLSGKLEVMAGTMNLGNPAYNVANDIEYATAGNPEVAISGGTLHVNGQIRRSVTIATGNLTYRQSGGEVFVHGKDRYSKPATVRGLVEVLNDGKLYLSGGTLTLVTGVYSGESRNTFGELYLNPGKYEVTGGTIVLGTTDTRSDFSRFDLYLGCPVYNVTVDGTTNAKEARLRTFEANLKGNLLIEGSSTSVFNTSGLAVNIGGDLVNSSSATVPYQTQTESQVTTFNGISPNQRIENNGTHMLSFRHLVVNNTQPGGMVTFTGSQELQVNADLAIEKGIFRADEQHLNLIGDFYNDAVFQSTGDAGYVAFANASNQFIYGKNGAEFGNMHINTGKSVIAKIDFRLDGAVSFDGAGSYLNIEDSRLTVSETGSFKNTGEDRFVMTNGALSDEGITKEFSAGGGLFEFPLGVGASGGKYTPATMNVANTGGVAGAITIKPINQPHPACTHEPVDELQYFWSVSSSGFSNPMVTHRYHYIEADVAETESNYVNARYSRDTYQWEQQTEDIDYINNDILFSNVNYIDGDYTAGYVENFGTVDVYYSSGNGNWESAGSWYLNSPTGPTVATVAPKGNPVFVQHGHTITTKQDGAYAASVDIAEGGRLALGSKTNHNLGEVSGGGTIALKATGAGSFVIPGGNYTQFMNTSTSTIEYSGAGTLPANIDVYQNVTFLGNSVKKIPAVDILVKGNWLIANGVVDNSDFNRTLRLEGNWENHVADGFNPGMGTVIFQGDKEQLLENTSGQESFYNLRMEKVNGSTLTLNSPASVNRVLTLTSGLINTTGTNLLTVDYANASAVMGGDDGAYVNGPLRRKVNNSSNAVFPVGKDGRYGELYLFGTSTAGSQYWTGEYFNAAPVDPSNLAAPLQIVSNNEYWTMQGVSGAEANIRLRWDAQSVIIPAGALDREKLRVAQYLPPWTKVGENVNDQSQIQGNVETSGGVRFDGNSQLFTLAIEQTASAEITSNDEMACNDGSTLPVTFTLTGDAPLQVVLQINGAHNIVLDNLSEGTHTHQFSYADLYKIAGAGDYEITIAQVTDVNGLNGIVLGSGVTLSALPTPAPVINGPASVLTGSTTTYSVTNTSGNAYVWSVNGLGTVDNSTNSTINIDWGNATGTATLTLTETSAGPNSCSTTVTYDIEVRDWPVITGDFEVCAGATETYATRKVTGHSYNWAVTGGTIQETAPYGHQITVVWSTQTAGRINLSQGPAGTEASTYQDVTINKAPSATLAAVGDANICDGEAIELQLGNTGGGTAPVYDLFLGGVIYTPYDALTEPKPNPYTTEPLIWEGPTTHKTYEFSVIVTNTNTGCASVPKTLEIKVYKKPQTGETYHISNETAK